MRILRSRFNATRLAVMFAMHPLAKRSRALAMSVVSVSTGTPTASMLCTSAGTRLRITSRSLNHQIEDDVDVGAPLHERGEPVAFDEARLREDRPERANGGLKRSRCPTCSTR